MSCACTHHILISIKHGSHRFTSPKRGGFCQFIILYWRVVERTHSRRASLENRVSILLFQFPYKESWEFEKRSRKMLAWQNSRHFASTPLVSPRSDVWETSAEIPYWWPVTIHIWVVLLIGGTTNEIYFNQSEVLPRSGQWHVISMEFLRSFLRRHSSGDKDFFFSKDFCSPTPLKEYYILSW